MQPLPIDPLLPQIVSSLRDARTLVLEAPPGAGKTTRVPRALLEDPSLEGREIWVLEPRRIAARLAARRVAFELGEEVGLRIGYRVRFEDVSSDQTRVRFMTEGMLTRQLISDPDLARVGAVLLDEFHERHLETDVALAMVLRLRERRPDLRLLVMSATLDAARVAVHVGAQTVRSEGRRFDVAIEHEDRPDDRPLPLKIVSAVRRVLQATPSGHVLVFVPGAREIRRTIDACSALEGDAGLELVPLHGDLPPDEQDRALRPSERRKVIVATNVAESSVTIDGVVAVIDSGLHRVAHHSPFSGLSTLRTERISRASATQRAGRAGRTQAGMCIRLYTRGDLESRPEHDAPEIARADLCETVLSLASQRVSMGELPFLDRPEAAALDAATRLLVRLGALDRALAITALGRSMLRFGVHPRLARLITYAEAEGEGEAGCALAALLSERDIRPDRPVLSGRDGRGRDGVSGPSDLLARLDDLRRVSRERFSSGEVRAVGLDPAAVQAVLRAERQLRRKLSRSPARPAEHEETLQRALLAAFPDRVARRRRPRSADLVLSSGGSLQQHESSVVHDAPFVVVVEASGSDDPRSPQTPLARKVSQIEPEWLLELFEGEVRDEVDVRFDAQSQRVVVSERLVYDRLVLDESPKAGGHDEAVARVLAEAAQKAGLQAFVDPPDALLRFLDRARFVASLDPAFPRVDDEALRERMVALCMGRRSFEELRRADLLGELASTLSAREQEQLRTWAPERLELPGGRRAPVSYEPGKPPYIESRLQDFFGMRQTPKVAAGRVALVVHLLAPNQRPVQITHDLEGFWQRHYPQVRRELCRKYPRHPWPEDPLTASPPPAKNR